MTIPVIDFASILTVAIFMVGVVYHAGRLSARVDSLEQWRAHLDTELENIAESLGRLEGLIKGERV